MPFYQAQVLYPGNNVIRLAQDKEMSCECGVKNIRHRRQVQNFSFVKTQVPIRRTKNGARSMRMLVLGMENGGMIRRIGDRAGSVIQASIRTSGAVGSGLNQDIGALIIIRTR